jgi:hypothetical protein
VTTISTHYLAARGIEAMAQEILMLTVAVGVVIAIVIGIIVGIIKSVKAGVGAGIAAVVLGIIFSIVIGNAAGFRDVGTQELQDRGIVPRTTYGQ